MVDVATLSAKFETSGIETSVAQVRSYVDALEAANAAAQPLGQALDNLGQQSQRAGAGHKQAADAAGQHKQASEGLSAAQSLLSRELGAAGVNVDQLTKTFSQAKAGISDLMNAETGLTNGTLLLGAGLAGLAAVGVASAVTGLTSLYSRIDDVKDATGLSTDTVQGFSKVIAEFGGSSEDATRPLTLLAREVGNIAAQVANGQEPSGKFADALGRLHLNAQTFADSSVSMDQKLRMLMDGVAGLGDKSQQTSLLMDIFGRSGARLADVMTTGSGALDGAIQRVHDLGGSLSDAAEPATLAYFKAQSDMNTAIDGIKIAVGTAALPALSSFITTVAEATAGVHKFIDEASGVNQPKQESWWEHFKNNILPEIEFNGKPLDLNKLLGLSDTQSSLDQVQQSLGHVAAAVGTETDAVQGLGAATRFTDDAIDKDRSTQNLWRAGMDAAGTSAVELKDHLDTVAASIGLGGGHAQASVDALKVLQGQMTAVSDSAGAEAEFQHRFGEALSFVSLSATEQKSRLAELDSIIKGSLDPSQKAAAQSQKDLDEAVRAMGPGAAETAEAAQRLANAWKDVDANGGNVPGQLDLIRTAAVSTTDEVKKLQGEILNLFSKPSSEELQIKAQLADLTVTMSDFNVKLADSSPALQHVAAMQKVYDNAVLTGQSVKQQADAKAALDRALADTGAAGLDIAAGQHQQDQNERTKNSLDAHLASLAAQRGAFDADTQAAINNAVPMAALGQIHVPLVSSATQTATDKTREFTSTTAGSGPLIVSALDPVTGKWTAIGSLIDTATTKIGGFVGAAQGIGGVIQAAERAAGLPVSGTTGGTALGPGIGTMPTATGDRLSAQQIAQGLLAAGIPPDAVANMTAILLAESGGSLTAGSPAGAQGFGQLMPGFEGISNAARMGTDPASLQAQFEAIARGFAGRGYNPWDPWSYRGGGDPNVNYGEVFVGAGQGSYQDYLAQARPAAAAALAAGGQFPAGGGAPAGIAGAPGAVSAAQAAANYRAMGLNPDGTPLTAGAAATAPTAAAADFGQLPSPAPDASATAIKGQLDDANRALAQLSQQAQTVDSTIKDSLNSVTQADVDAARTMRDSARTTADEKIAAARDADTEWKRLIETGAPQSEIDAQKEVAKAATDSANSAVSDYTRANTTFTELTRAGLQNYTEAQRAMAQLDTDTYNGRVALYGLAKEQEHIQGLGRVDEHKVVNQQTLADDRGNLENYQGLATTAYQTVSDLQRRSTEAHKQLDTDQLNHADAAVLAYDQAQANSIDASLQHWQGYFGQLGQLGDQAYARLTADQQAYQQASAAGLQAALGQQDEGFAIARQVAAYNRAATDPTADPRARAQAGAAAAAYPRLEQERFNLQHTLDELNKTFNDPKNAGWSPEQKAELQRAILQTDARLQGVNTQLGDLNITTKGLPVNLEGALATDFNKIVGALGLAAAEAARAAGTLPQVAAGLPSGGGGPAAGTPGGPPSTTQMEDIQNQFMDKYISNQWAIYYQIQAQQQFQQAQQQTAQNWADFLAMMKSIGATLSGDLSGQFIAFMHERNALAAPFPGTTRNLLAGGTILEPADQSLQNAAGALNDATTGLNKATDALLNHPTLLLLNDQIVGRASNRNNEAALHLAVPFV